MIINWSILSPRKDKADVEVSYSRMKTEGLTDTEIKECADLFSSSYGNYSKTSAVRPGEKIKMGAGYYKKNYCKPGFYVALAKIEGKLVGQAFYIRKRYEGYGMMTWVLQLVVDRSHRKKGIASTLLRSIWGFSDDYAWGLATANPCTVKTLESATFRKCKPVVIRKNLRAIKLIGADTTFVNGDSYDVTNCSSQVNTKFFVDNSEFASEGSCEEYLGKLKPGYEWLAFTFQNQDLQLDKYIENFDKTVAFSEKILKETYSRMDIVEHGWAKGTPEEVAFMMQYLNQGTVLDFGCGTGRHSIELARKGYRVHGIDFAQKHIDYANNCKVQEGLEEKCSFECADVRKFRGNERVDNLICMYDVIGSFPEEKDNRDILLAAYDNLKVGGIMILSVMNMELTDYIVPQDRKVNLQKNPNALLKLPPSRIMKITGNIFDPEYIVIDTRTDLVYRKEQFDDDSNLSAEYVIRDKRYRMKEIRQLVKEIGFEILTSRYVRSGHFEEELTATDIHAKEICIVARK